MNRLIKTFIELVKIDSPSSEEDKVREYIINYLDSLGVTSEVDISGNLLARIDGSSTPVLLCAHMDTVEPGRDINPVIQDGVIMSSGNTILGADNKAAVAAILESLRETKSKKVRSIEVLFTVREEKDSGINEFDFSILNSEYGLIADRGTPLGSIVTSSPWIVDLKIDIRGKPVHSAYPEQGINALNIAVNFLKEVVPGRLDKETTYNIGAISGGDATNTVPGRVVLEGELRSFNKKRLHEYLDKLRNFTNEHNDGVIINLIDEPYGSGYVYGKDDKAIDLVVKAMEKLGLSPVFERSYGGSDANALIANGIKAVNIGDGSRYNHTVNEEISVEDLTLLRDIFINYIRI